MAAGDATLALPMFPAGTSVRAYKGADVIAALDGTSEATVTTSASQVATFTGLAQGPHYVVDAPTNEVQTLTIDATAGNRRYRFGVDTTLVQAYNVSAANLQTALRALPSIGGANVTVTGGPGDSGGTTPYVITFIGTLAATNVAAIEVLAGDTVLSGGGATATLVTTTPGRPGNAQRVSFVPAAA